MRSFTIGALAKAAQVNLQTIRYYEREGLLPKPPRGPSGYRVFSADSVRRVHFIKRAQDLGFSLAEIKELLALRIDLKGGSADVLKLAQGKIAEIDQKIGALKAMKNVMKRLTDHCPGCGPVSECPILESLDGANAE